MAKNKETEFKKESEANAAPSTALAIFNTAPGEVDLSRFKRRNMPQMVKPGDVPVGAVITATIVDVVDSPVSTIKGKLLWLETNGQEFTFPLTGVIRNALVQGKADKEAEEAIKKLIGKTIVLKRSPDRTSSKYKKSMFMFDVYTN